MDAAAALGERLGALSPSGVAGEEAALLLTFGAGRAPLLLASAGEGLETWELPAAAEPAAADLLTEALVLHALFHPYRHYAHFHFPAAPFPAPPAAAAELPGFAAAHAPFRVLDSKLFFLARVNAGHLKSLIANYFAVPLAAVEHHRSRADGLKVGVFVFSLPALDLTSRLALLLYAGRRPVLRRCAAAEEICAEVARRVLALTDLTRSAEAAPPTLFYALPVAHRLPRLNRAPRCLFLVIDAGVDGQPGLARPGVRERVAAAAEEAFALFKFHSQLELLDTSQQHKKRRALREEVALCAQLALEVEAELGTAFLSELLPGDAPDAAALTAAITRRFCRL